MAEILESCEGKKPSDFSFNCHGLVRWSLVTSRLTRPLICSMDCFFVFSDIFRWTNRSLWLLHYGFLMPYGLHPAPQTIQMFSWPISQMESNWRGAACEWFDWLKSWWRNKLAHILFHPNLNNIIKSKITLLTYVTS